MFLYLLPHSLNGFHMLFFFTFGIDEDVIKVHYHENIKPPCQDCDDIILESDWWINQSKKHHLTF